MTERASDAFIADTLGVSRTAVRRWRREAGIPPLDPARAGRAAAKALKRERVERERTREIPLLAVAAESARLALLSGRPERAPGRAPTSRSTARAGGVSELVPVPFPCGHLLSVPAGTRRCPLCASARSRDVGGAAP